MRDGHDPKSESAARTSSAASDPLSDVLQAVRLTGALFFIVDGSSPWVAEAPSGDLLAPVLLPGAQRVISFHVVREGRCWCALPEGAGVALEAGEIIVLPHGDRYLLSDSRGGRMADASGEALEWFRRMAAGQLPPVSIEGGGGPGRVSVMCGFLGCDVAPFNPVLATLPRLIHLRPPSDARGDRLPLLLELLVAEARERREGQRSMLLRIGELLFVEVVRRQLAAIVPGETGWLAGLRDPIVGRALAALHGAPAQAWTLEELARRAGSSRSALAQRFTHLVGQPPMHYLTRWRLQLAASMLRAREAKVSAVARAVGYDSEAAFSRAFKRAVGRSPAAWRAAP